MDRKRRRPALEDEEEIAARPVREVVTETVDPPRKRLDTCRLNGQNQLNFGQISEGSPITPRRQAFKYVSSHKKNYYYYFIKFSSNREIQLSFL